MHPLLFAFLRGRGLKSTTIPGTWILSVSSMTLCRTVGADG